MELSPMHVARLAETRFVEVHHVSCTGSTNTDVLALGRAGEPEGLVLVADEQTAGRGRRGRTWDAAPGDALLLTVLLRPYARRAGLVTASLALAAWDACVAVGVPAESVGIKWPNDVVEVGGARQRSVDQGPDRKLAGILAEAEWPARANVSAGWVEPGPQERALVAAGIGVNLHWPPEETDGARSSDELATRAVSLDELAGARVERADALVEFLVALEQHYDGLQRKGPEAVLERWRERCVTLGRRVRVDLGVDDVEGTAAGIDDDGNLLVDTLEGARRSLAVGDVVHLR